MAVGTELLLGETVETNGTWLCQRLAREGIIVRRRAIVGDDRGAIVSAVSEALARTRAVICTGGLGPTPDDMTRSAVASLYGWPLQLDEAWLDTIRERFRARGLEMPQVNRVQAEVPRGAHLLVNALGTAPGLVLDDATRGLTILLPGVPRELCWLTDEHVVPLLRERITRGAAPVQSRVLRTTGLPESGVSERIDDIVRSIAPLTIAFLPVGIGIDLRLTSWGGSSAADAARALDAAEQRIRDRLGEVVYGTGDQDLAGVVGRELVERGLTVAIAESCTGGLLAKRLTDVPGASGWVHSAIVAYADEAKRALLGVDPAILREHGAVSEPTARAMSDGARRVTGAQAALSVTGIAGPAGGSAEKPVGTVWIAAAVGDQCVTRLYRFHGSRGEIRARAAQAALALLLELLRGKRWSE